MTLREAREIAGPNSKLIDSYNSPGFDGYYFRTSSDSAWRFRDDVRTRDVLAARTCTDTDIKQIGSPCWIVREVNFEGPSLEGGFFCNGGAEEISNQKESLALDRIFSISLECNSIK
jgi:hypothetical protein